MTNQRNHIAIFLQDLSGGGAERVMVNLAASLAERGFRVDLILANASGPNRKLIPPSVNLIDFKVSRVLHALRPLSKYLKETQPDTLVSALNHANVLAVMARTLSGTKVRVVVTEHNNLSSKTKYSKGTKIKWLPLAVKWAYPKADARVAVSHGVAEDLALTLAIPLDSIRVIYNPTIPDWVVKAALESPDHRWFEAKSCPILIGMGRLNRQKDFPTLIKAFQIVRESMTAKLLILGEGSERSSLESLISDLNMQNCVELPGYVLNPYCFLAHSDCFALSSLHEGLPGGLIEALACGTPVVSTNCPSGPEEILKGGEYGILTPVGDVQALAAGILRVFSGSGIAPPFESWQPFRESESVDNYVKLLLGDL